MSTRTIKVGVGVLLIAAAALSSAVISAADARAGMWKLNLEKSKFSPGPPPQGPNTQKIETVDNGVKVVADGVNAQGQKTHTEYTVKFDGKDYPQKPMLDGKPAPNGADTISAKKIDDSTIELTTKRQGTVVTTVKDTISKDGNTRTATVTGTNAQGQAINITAVWEKQ
jgi:hypothetical protein